ncbi:MAG: hypothetical protein WC728_17405 [Elusimicrobiota bacterium]
MIKRSSAVLVAIPLLACAALAKTVSQEVSVAADQKIRIDADRGEVAIAVSKKQSLSYEVEFVTDRKSFWPLGGRGLSEEQSKDSWASFDAGTGTLRVHAAKGVNALIKVGVPATAALDLKLGAGKVRIEARSGRVDAELLAGTMSYDGAGLPRGACVDALVKTGVTRNTRDSDCASVGAKLRNGTGTITID